MHTRRLTSAATLAALIGGVLSAFVTMTPTHNGAVPGVHHRVALRAPTADPLANPATNVPPTPDYWPVCAADGVTSQICIDTEVAAINNARALEGVRPMVLPPGFAQMSPDVQTFVVSNLERVDRGLAPAAGMVDSLNSVSTTAAQNDADPALSSWTIGPFSANRWGSIWAGDLNALAADYDWMYNDGWSPTGSYNLDCTSSTAPGCWGHRDNIISAYGGEQLVTGVGWVKQPQWTSIAQIFAAGIGSYPAFTTTWTDVSGGTATTVASSNAATPTSDPTHARISVPRLITAGASATVTGWVTDTTTGAGVPAAAVSLCHRATTSTASSCTAGGTDGLGYAKFSVHPTTSTYYWLTYAGSSGTGPSASALATLQVRPALRLTRSHGGGGWNVTARMSPARGQAVQVQRWTGRAWTTVRTRSAASSMTFTRLRAGSYRVVVRAGSGLSATSSSIRCA